MKKRDKAQNTGSLQRKQATQPVQIKRREMCRLLNEKGYKRIPTLTGLFLNANGQIYDLNTRKELKPTSKNHIIVGSKYLNLPKLVLLTFKKEQIRSGQIRYIDGNRCNLNPQNLEYATKYNNEKNSINHEHLKTAIRCYFAVENRYNTKDCVLTRMYLMEIINCRLFYIEYSKRPYIDIFICYMEGITNSRAMVAKEHKICVRDCNYIVNDFTNLLINDVLHDLQAGILTVKDYYKKKTKTEQIRETNEYLKRMGYKPLRLRKKSAKEKTKEYLKRLKSI